MENHIPRETAIELLRKYNKDPFHLHHALTVEGVMRWYANQLGFADEEDFWGIVGLLHDIDFEMYPEEHCIKAFAAGCSREVIEQGAAMLGWPLDDLLQKTLDAMKYCEASVAEESAILSV